MVPVMRHCINEGQGNYTARTMGPRRDGSGGERPGEEHSLGKTWGDLWEIETGDSWGRIRVGLEATELYKREMAMSKEKYLRVCVEQRWAEVRAGTRALERFWGEVTSLSGSFGEFLPFIRVSKKKKKMKTKSNTHRKSICPALSLTTLKNIL